MLGTVSTRGPAERRAGRTRNAEIADCVVGYVVGDGIELNTLGLLAGVELPEAVEPRDLEDLLGKEEGADEVRLRAGQYVRGRLDVSGEESAYLWAPERNVGIVDILHVRATEQTILLGCKVNEEGSRRLVNLSVSLRKEVVYQMDSLPAISQWSKRHPLWLIIRSVAENSFGG